MTSGLDGSASNVDGGKSFFSAGDQQTLVGGDHLDSLAKLLLQQQGGTQVDRVGSSQRMAHHQFARERKQRVYQVDPNVEVPGIE